MPLKLCVLMDPIEKIHFAKDTTLALMLEAQARQWEIYYLEQPDLFLQSGQVLGQIKQIKLHHDPHQWFTFLTPAQKIPLSDFDVVLMRKDPPVDLAYFYTTYLLELAQKQGVLVVNDPRSLRDVNEKLFTAWFEHCCPETLVTAQPSLLKAFRALHQKIVVKPLNGMGGEGICLLDAQEININPILETMTQNGHCPIMAQRYLPEIAQGDKRILMIDGEPYPYALSRIPSEYDFRGNLAQGATGIGCELNDRDRWLCEQVGPTLKEKGLFFVGLDVIGDYLTEINVTSPTCVREIEAAFKVNVCAHILDRLEATLK